MITFLLVYYAITGLVTSGSLLTNKETNNSSKTDITLCITAGLLWPIALTIFSTALFYNNVKDIYRVRREKQFDNMALFIRKLYKLRLISRLSMLQAIAIINTKQQ